MNMADNSFLHVILRRRPERRRPPETKLARDKRKNTPDNNYTAKCAGNQTALPHNRKNWEIIGRRVVI
jgi:hypothetical protein